jgi:hypothetical protein
MTTDGIGSPRIPRRKRANGQLARVKNPASAANGKPHKSVITGHGANSRVLKRASLHRGSALGREYAAQCEALTAHLGGAPSDPERLLIDQAARIHLLVQFAWAELLRAGAFHEGEPRPAFDAFRRAAADQREVLRLLGIERRTKPVPDLHSYLGSAHAEQR